MTIELRVPEPDDFVDFVAPTFMAFGDPAPEKETLESARVVWEQDRSIGALDGGQWVGGTGAYSFDMTLPGGATAAAAGVTMVGVLPSHRRQGILTRLMSQQLDDVVERGEAFAILTASETSIYGRFGYGPATMAAEVRLARDRSQFREPLDSKGSLRLVPSADAVPVLMEAYDKCWRRRPGGLSRSEAYWKRIQLDLPAWRDGASARHYLIHRDADGRPDGYALYRVQSKWDHELPDSRLQVSDLAGASDEVEAEIWRFLLDIDLVSEVQVEVWPIDDSLRWRLLEPRRLRTTLVADLLWVRVLDVVVALTKRSYRAEGNLVLEVVDEFRPASGGRFRLEAGPEGAACAPTKASADLTLGASELGMLLLGGVTPRALAGAGRLDAHTPEALAKADLLFPTIPAPFCATGF